MKDEITSAVDFLAAKLQSSFDDEELNRFKGNLFEVMFARFQNHWHPERPIRGNAFRCLNIEEGTLDPVLREVVLKSELSITKFAKVFPHGLALWIDPNDVSYRLGKGTISPIYRRFDKPSPKLTSLNANSPSFTPRTEVRTQVSPLGMNSIQARFSPPPGFTQVQASESGRFSPQRISDLGHEFSTTTWSNASFASTWSDKRVVSELLSDADSRHCSTDRNLGFQNFPRSNGWKTGRKSRPVWNTSVLTGNSSAKFDRFNRFHWYKDELPSLMDKQNFEFKGIPQEVY